MAKATAVPTTIEAYIAASPAAVRPVLKQNRARGAARGTRTRTPRRA